LHWKSEYFCVNSFEAFIWKATDVAIIAMLIAAGACLLYGLIKKRGFSRAP